MRAAIIIFTLFHAGVTLAQSSLTEGDTTLADTSGMLLLDQDVQIETAQAVNDMYNFKFAEAEKQFRWLGQDYPDHPLPYFLLGLSEWWKMAPNIDNTQYDDRFLIYMEQAIEKAMPMYRADKEDVEANFFLSAAYGFKGRLYSERKNWRKAASAGKNALKYLDKSRNKNHLSPEFLFGDALYNYYSVWIPENYPLLKPILVFFKRGDKDLGIQQLKEVARNAFYTRTEAQFFLMRILSLEEKDEMGALQVSEYLAKTFPDNPYFQRYHARLLYVTGRYGKTERVSLDILSKIDNGMMGYGPVTGRYAAFFLGQIYQGKNKLEDSGMYYERAIKFAQDSDDLDTGYYYYSLLGLGDIALLNGDDAMARSYYKRVKKEAKRKHPAFQRAKQKLSSV